MIRFEVENNNEGITISLDTEGIDQMINYLRFIRGKSDHIHLLAGNELNEEVSQGGNRSIKHVKLQSME